jgi:hypothetical protein
MAHHPPHHYPPQYPPQHQAGYEFGPGENQILSGNATWCIVLAVVELAHAAFTVATSFAIERIAVAVLHVAIALVLLLASGGFRRVVTTQGDDIRHLTAAIDRLGTLFVIRIVLLCLVFVALAIGALIAAMTLVRLL